MKLYYINCEDKDLDKFKPYMIQVSKVLKGSGSEANMYLTTILKSYYVANVLSNDPALLDHTAFLDKDGTLNVYVYHDRDWVRVDKLEDSTVNRLIGNRLAEETK